MVITIMYVKLLYIDTSFLKFSDISAWCSGLPQRIQSQNSLPGEGLSTRPKRQRIFKKLVSREVLHMQLAESSNTNISDENMSLWIYDFSGAKRTYHTFFADHTHFFSCTSYNSFFSMKLFWGECPICPTPLCWHCMN